MALVATRVLVINQQLRFSVTVKQTLEKLGGFEVASFTSVDTALEYLKQHPQDVVLVDLTMPELPGEDIILRLRSIQPDIAVIISPKRDEFTDLVQLLDLQGAIDVPIRARELVPMIEDAVAHMRDTLPDTAQAPAVTEESETLLITPPDVPEFSSLDSVVVKMGGLEPDALEQETPVPEESREKPKAKTREKPRSSPEAVSTDREKSDQPDPLFDKLASEEPPAPPLEESGTVRDLMIGVSDTNLGRVIALLQGNDNPEKNAAGQQPDDYVDKLKERAAQLDSQQTEKIPALVVLETVMDDTTPIEAFSLDELLTNIEQQIPAHQRDVRPLPSWLKQPQEGQGYVDEPDFLADIPADSAQLESYTQQTTKPSSPEDTVAHPEELETDRLELTRRSRPVRPDDVPRPDTLPEMDLEQAVPAHPEPDNGDAARHKPLAELTPPEAVSDDDEATGPMPPAEAEALQADFERMGAAPPKDTDDNQSKAPNEVVGIDSEDPYIAQLALHLTQVSLELTADATLLAKDGGIVAYAGTLPIEEVEDLGEAVADDWDADPQEARIRFITLPSSGKDYMVYSRRTAGNFILSMIFAATMPLRAIRRQSDRLAEALANVPEITVEAPAPDILPELAIPKEDQAPAEAAPIVPAVEVGPLTSFTYIWLLRDTERPLTDRVAQAIVAGLDLHLTNISWNIKTFRVHEDYIYLMVDATSDPSPHEVIRDLMSRSAEIAAARDRAIDPETLWADSYLVVIPGRELSVEEIQRFINFARAF